MNKAEEMGFVEQAQSELQQRIKQTTSICERFKNSASGYSSNVPQIILLVFLATVVSVSVWAILNTDIILNIFSAQDYDRISMLVRAALMGVCLYITLHMIKKIIRIIRTAKIDGHVFKVRNIEKYLQTKLNKLSSIASESDKLIFGNTNERLNSKYDVDTDIAKYSNIVKIYSNPDDNALKTALTLTHWLSGVLFMIVLLIISTPFVVEKVGGQAIIEETRIQNPTPVIIYGTVIPTVLNVRSGPARTFSEQDRLREGDKIEVLETNDKNSWVKIKYGTSKIGYVDGDFLSMEEVRTTTSEPLPSGKQVKNNFFIFICFLYVTVLMVLYMIFQELIAGNTVFRMPKRGKHIIIGLIIGGGIGGGIGFLISGINGAVIGSLIGFVISGLIGGGFFSSDIFSNIIDFVFDNGLIFIFIIIGAVIGGIIGGVGADAGSGASAGATIGAILGAILGVISGDGCAGFFLGGIIGAIVFAIIGAIIGAIAGAIDGSNGIITCAVVSAVIFGIIGGIVKRIIK